MVLWTNFPFFTAVDGGYSEWSEFYPCSLTCGGGIKVRVRNCNNPPSSRGGKDCSSLGPEKQECNTHKCRSSEFHKLFSVYLNESFSLTFLTHNYKIALGDRENIWEIWGACVVLTILTKETNVAHAHNSI